ncbi:hypothetical protein B0F90DRAFT_858567 [Multifurca ochricompacta]|uniref:Uncharacterized protein n=1 Tax=Multifurca ochricompacta TaxID=376703 RepID=A0AAD4QGH7_9AGAM|nr:hypothetical protein B0F90DRAFT_858567 [Multifurca ochricompacta]
MNNTAPLLLYTILYRSFHLRRRCLFVRLRISRSIPVICTLQSTHALITKQNTENKIKKGQRLYQSNETTNLPAVVLSQASQRPSTHIQSA